MSSFPHYDCLTAASRPCRNNLNFSGSCNVSLKVLTSAHQYIRNQQVGNPTSLSPQNHSMYLSSSRDRTHVTIAGQRAPQRPTACWSKLPRHVVPPQLPSFKRLSIKVVQLRLFAHILPNPIEFGGSTNGMIRSVQRILNRGEDTTSTIPTHLSARSDEHQPEFVGLYQTPTQQSRTLPGVAGRARNYSIHLPLCPISQLEHSYTNKYFSLLLRLVTQHRNTTGTNHVPLTIAMLTTYLNSFRHQI